MNKTIKWKGKKTDHFKRRKESRLKKKKPRSSKKKKQKTRLIETNPNISLITINIIEQNT